jgi:hypothetical protein
MIKSKNGGIIFGFILVILFILAASYFLPVPANLKNSAVKQLLNCPSQTMAFGSMIKDKKLTYYEYFIFKFKCSAKEVQKTIKKSVK